MRSLWMIVLPVFLVQSISVFIFFNRHWGRATEAFAQNIAREIFLFSRFSKKEKETYRLWLKHNGFKDIYFYKKRLESDKRRQVLRNFLLSYAKNRLIYALNQAGLQTQSIVIAKRELKIDIQTEEGVWVFVLSRTRLFSRTSFLFLLWSLGIALLTLGIAAFFMRRQTRSLRDLAAWADDTHALSQGKALRIGGPREVRKVALSFLNMHRRLRDDIEERLLMLAGLSHDLRTPLTRMKLQLSLMPSSQDRSSLEEEISHMAAMIKTYMEFLRDGVSENFQQVSLFKIIDEYFSKISSPPHLTLMIRENPAEKEKKVLLREKEGVRQETCMIALRVQAFKRIIENLLGNAYRYARARVDVFWSVQNGSNGYEEIAKDNREISLKEGMWYLICIVRDDGPGLHHESLKRIFMPFYKADTARSGESGTSGLGLAIVKKLALAQGGSVHARSPQEGGLEICVCLPLEEEPVYRKRDQ